MFLQHSTNIYIISEILWECCKTPLTIRLKFWNLSISKCFTMVINRIVCITKILSHLTFKLYGEKKKKHRDTESLDQC